MKNYLLSNEVEQTIARFHKPLFGTRSTLRNFWIDQNSKAANFSLIHSNVFSKTNFNDTLHYVSAADMGPDELESKGYIFAGVGCLGGVLYTVQAYPEEANEYRLHNFGSVVMDFRGYSDLTPYIVSVTSTDKNISPVNYLGMGELFHYIHENDPFVPPKLLLEYDTYRDNSKIASSSLLERTIKQYKDKKAFTSYKEAIEYIQEVAHCATVFKSLSYFYFEAVSLSVMLYSRDKNSKKMLSLGEYNNKLYVEINNRFHKKRLQKRFASYEFSPTVIELQKILSEMQDDDIAAFRFNELFTAIANNIVFYVGSNLKTNEDVDGMIFYDFCGELQEEKKYQSMIEGITVKYMNEYWKKNEIEIVYNSAIEKGELGITPFVPSKNISINHGKYARDIKSVTSIESVPITIKARP